MKKSIVQTGDPVLRAVAKPVAKKDIGSRKIASVIARMRELLKKEEFGVAIAAPQIGESLRIFVIAGKAFKKSVEDEETGDAATADMVFINPEIIRLSKKKREMSEGCLSVRGKYGTVMRHEKASVRAQGEDGRLFVHHGSGLIAHIFQHEVDHLEGVLYTDKTLKLEDEAERDKLREEYPPH